MKTHAQSRSNEELREQLYAERIAIGREQYRQALRLKEIRLLLQELEETARNG
ncbi:hypothetical protein ACVGVM_19315 [Pseudonocardia bannensis]|uniref:Uncharacterized protein n=1 Tax=Pseudonocardia bannensis TaxID=630973 RepID=A0A848DJG5_9PSEU|nr:hypothetical protein [Pseudonocardia bannensis]NMH92679.1 hypothetical protein [Pseudonocardia bannensis]